MRLSCDCLVIVLWTAAQEEGRAGWIQRGLRQARIPAQGRSAARRPYWDASLKVGWSRGGGLLGPSGGWAPVAATCAWLLRTGLPECVNAGLRPYGIQIFTKGCPVARKLPTTWGAL